MSKSLAFLTEFVKNIIYKQVLIECHKTKIYEKVFSRNGGYNGTRVDGLR